MEELEIKAVKLSPKEQCLETVPIGISARLFGIFCRLLRVCTTIFVRYCLNFDKVLLGEQYHN